MVYFDIQKQIPNNFNPNFYIRECNHIPQRREEEEKKKDVLKSLTKNKQNILRHIHPTIIYNTTNGSLFLKNYFPISLNKRIFLLILTIKSKQKFMF